MAQKICDVVLVHVRCPEPRGECMPQIMEVEIADPGRLNCLLETDHHLSPLPPRALEEGLIDEMTHRRLAGRIEEFMAKAPNL